MRQIEYYRFGKFDKETNAYLKIKVGYAWFHQWGCNYEEFESGAGNFTTAIIELGDGSIENIYATLIKFTHPENEPKDE